MNNLRVAVGFLTRLPMGDVAGGGQVRISASVAWFPTVGLAIGAMAGLVFVGLSQFLTPLVSAVLTVAVVTLATGAFHLDGLADMADAFGGGWTVEQRLEILKDSRLGTYGTAAVMLALFAEVAAISDLEPWVAFRALIAAHALSRAIAVVILLVAPASGEGMVASFGSELSWFGTAPGVLVGLSTSVLLLGKSAIFALPLAIVVAALVVWMAVQKIGGVNGDVLGAVQVLTAIAVLVSAGV